MHRCLRGKRMVQLSLQQNESSVVDLSLKTILDEKTGELRSVINTLRSQSSTDSSNSSLDFSNSESDYVPSEDSDITFCEDVDDMSDEEILDSSTGLFTKAQNGDGRAKKRRSRGQGDRSQWKRQKNAEARLKGQAYTGFKKDDRGKYVQIACKPAKSLGQRCKGHSRETKQRGPKQCFTCDDLTEVQRETIFNDFWKLRSWEARKTFVRSLVLRNEPQYRRKSAQDGTKKNITMKYHLISQTGENCAKLNVCKDMFLSTLGIGKRQLRDWLLTNTDNITIPNNNLASDKEMSVITFLDKLAKVESHYCRASSSKLYLEPVWDSYNHIFEVYKNTCIDENKSYCSRRYFLKIFRKLNYDIFSPRKDQCNKCISYKQGHLSQTDYDAHQIKKERARNEKEQDKCNSESDNLTFVYSMDVQAVLLCPNLQASASYYKTKLKVHNYTIYNMKNKEAACYIWHEGNGGLESDVFATNLSKHLKHDIDKFKPSKIILWSDGCGYQNRCLTLANALLDLAIENNIIIEQKYLEVGHTQMEVDSIHSVIEKKLRGRKRDIFVPADYVSIIRSARQNPEPYKVFYLTYKDFNSFSQGKYKSLRPGNKKGDPYVTDIVALQYDPKGIINYKTNFDQAWECVPRRPLVTAPLRLNERPSLYHKPLAIEVTKFGHLQEMKKLIPSDHHVFFDSLEHGCSDIATCPHIQPCSS